MAALVYQCAAVPCFPEGTEPESRRLPQQPPVTYHASLLTPLPLSPPRRGRPGGGLRLSPYLTVN